MSSLDAGQYLTFRQDFVFRSFGSLKIPKEFDGGEKGRKKMYELAVDVIIESIGNVSYENYKSIPPHGFYGYATVVLQDCCALKIPLEYSRQRIYFGRLDEAFTAWNSLAFWLRTEKRFLEILANSLRTDGGYIVNLCGVDPFPVNFRELPIREVYVKTSPLTQFRIELSWVEPAAFTDDCGVEHKGESNQTDDDGGKDDGLPKDGVMPKNNSPDYPFVGNNPVTAPSSSSPFYIDPSNIGNPNTDTGTTPTEGQEDGKSYNVTVNFSVDYYNSSNAKVGSGTGEVYFPIVIGKIQGIYENPAKEIRGGDYVGVVSQDVFILQKGGLISGSLGNTNIFPPYPASFGGTKWQLFGITGFSIVAN